MHKFSVAEAFSAGVGLIERMPWTIVVWGFVMLLIQILPRLFFWAVSGDTDLGALHLTGPDMSMAAIAGANPGAPPTPDEVMSRLSLMSGGVALTMIWGLLGAAVLHSAVYRAVLNPGDRGFAYLRLGAAEFWQALVLFVQAVLAILIAILILIVCSLLWQVAKVSAEPAVRVGAMLAMFAVIALIVAVVVRFTLSGPMTFSERAFRLFESWGLTKGNGWRVFWTKYASTALVVGVELMFLFLLLLPVDVVISAVFGPPNMTAGAVFTKSMELSSAATPLLAAGALLIALAGCVIMAAARTISLAPSAAIYSALREKA